MNRVAVKPANQERRILILRMTFIAIFPLILFSRSAWLEPEWMFEVLEVSGVSMVIFAVLGRFWSILYIGGRKNQLVMQDGPYSICRHPLYMFSTMGVVGLGLMLGSVVLTAILGLLTFAILTSTAKKEEEFLRAEFGDAYDIYATRTPRILPNITLFQTEDDVTFNVKTLKVNFFDALVFLSFIPLAEIMEWVKEENLVPTFLIY